MHLMSHTLMKESIAHEARRLGSVKDQPTSLFEWKQSELKHTHTHTLCTHMYACTVRRCIVHVNKSICMRGERRSTMYIPDWSRVGLEAVD